VFSGNGDKEFSEIEDLESQGWKRIN
jgi:hypothetical protein